ncbi:MAG: hypothetical protein M1338_04575 [Patescibacteria group bacterium]|nr:hypothetical protein [Patescibacteria group bacterium]
MENQKGLAGIWVTILVILVLAIGAVGGYYYFKNKDTKTAPTTPTLTPTATVDMTTWKTYTNKKYGYSIKYPSNWTYREYPDTKNGAGFRLSTSANDVASEVINIAQTARPTSQEALSFENYVKIAATQEIQNYESQVSSTQITTTSGLIGYETTWSVSSLTNNTMTTSLPIAYFNAANKKDTVQVTITDKAYLDTYNNMLTTFNLTK